MSHLKHTFAASSSWWSMCEAVMVEGQAGQTNTFRWEDDFQTAGDPSDDHTIWYFGDYLKEGATSYSTRIAAFACATRKTAGKSSPRQNNDKKA